MSTLVESLKRLYENGKVTNEKLAAMQTEGKTSVHNQWRQFRK